MGKPKEKPKVALPKAGDVPRAKPFVEGIAKAKARLGKVQAKHESPSDPRNRAARKRVKRAQRKLRELLKYEASRAKPATPAAAEAPAAPPAS